LIVWSFYYSWWRSSGPVSLPTRQRLQRWRHICSGYVTWSRPALPVARLATTS